MTVTVDRLVSSKKDVGDTLKAEHINPFIISVCKIMKDMCMMDLKIGKPSLKQSKYADDESLIKLGLIGSLKGNVVLKFEHETALGVVSKMMMMPVNTIDEIGQSAISELGNMIAGNAATIFSNASEMVDITTPSYFIGADFSDYSDQVFSIPFETEVGSMSIDINILDG